MTVPIVPLWKCPPGPFLFNELLCFKTEYGATDAYVMSTGEAFWGGVTNSAERADLLVTPIDTDHIIIRRPGRLRALWHLMFPPLTNAQKAEAQVW